MDPLLTILPLPDFYVEDKETGSGSHCYFASFSKYRKIIEEDGALKLNAADMDLCDSAFFALLNPRIASSSRLVELTVNKLSLSTACESDIVRILRSFTGPSLVGGSFGIMFNE